MPSQPIRILLVDDHTLFRRGIAQLLAMEADMEVVGEAADGVEAYSQALQLRPNVVLLDLDMPRCTGVDALCKIRAGLPEAVVIFLTDSTSRHDVAAALFRGAQGYLLKNLEPQTLCTRIREALQGEMPIAPEVIRSLFESMEGTQSGLQPPTTRPHEGTTALLTIREQEIVELLATGATNREIAASLFLSENTVKNHVKHILAKYQLHNRAQVVAWAMRRGLLESS